MAGLTQCLSHMARLLPLLVGVSMLGASLSPSLAASPSAAATELTIFGDMPVVLSAARLIQPLDDAPGAVTVIDRQMIEASGARDLAELLKYAPGFQLGRFKGATPLTTYHGLSDDQSRRMLVRVDGRSAYSPYFGSAIEWAKLSVDIDDIERIEVFRGSNSAAYGSNAFLGIVDIVTRPAADTPRFRTRITEGANGLQDQMVSVRQRLGDATARLTLGQNRSDGTDPNHDSYRNQRIDGRIDWPLSPDDTLEIHLGFVDTRADEGAAEDITDPERSTDSYTGFAQARWRRQLASGDELKLTYFHQEERYTDPGFRLPSLSSYLINVAGFSPAAVNAFFVSNGIPADAYVDGSINNRALRDDIELEHQTLLGERARLVWGGGIRNDRVRSERVFSRDDDIHIRQRRLFANLEYRLPPMWTFNAGAMIEDTSETGPRVSPRLAVNLHLNKQLTTRAAVSRGYRNTSPFERQADVRYAEARSGYVLAQTLQPSGDLRPEKVTAHEIGLRFQSTDGFSSIDLRVFNEEIDQLLERKTTTSNLSPPPPLNSEGDSPLYINGASATINGAELSGVYRWGTDAWIGGHYTYTDIDSNVIEAQISAPREAFFLFAATQLPWQWQLSGGWGYMGMMSWYDDDDWIHGYHHASARIAKRWRTGNATAELAVGMDRIAGAVSDYRPEISRPPEGYVTLRLTY